VNKIQKATKARIKKITKELEEQLGLGGWLTIKHLFDEGMDGDKAVGEDGLVIGTKVTAITTATWQYRQAKITWFLGTSVGATDNYLRQTAIHEYIHILMQPVTSFLFQYLREDEAAIESIRTMGQYAMLEELATESIMRVIGHAMELKDVH
jgi:hypothetical protein